MPDCGISSADTLEIPQSCMKSSMCSGDGTPIGRVCPPKKNKIELGYRLHFKRKSDRFYLAVNVDLFFNLKMTVEYWEVTPDW